MRVLLLGLMIVSIAFGAASSDLKLALSSYESKDFEAARRSAESILLSGRGEELEAALYLLVRINLATGQADRALRGAERLLDAFPNGEYVEYARFSRAESSFLLGELNESRTDLQWCADSSKDRRLADRARAILEERSEFDPQEYLVPQNRPAAMRDAIGSEHRPRIALLLAFPELHDPAADQLKQSFVFAAAQLDKFDVEVSRVGSAFAAVQELDRVARENYDLLVFAGDEGAATAIALANADHEFPILKLTSTPRSLAHLSTGLVEFLPSQEAQALTAARYAGMELQIPHGLMLTPESDAGQAQRDGFKRCTDFSLELDSAIEYPADANNVRPELYDALSAPNRLARGGEVVEAVLSREEREKLFGSTGKGETSLPPLPETSAGREAFFFALSGDQIINYCTQLGRLPKDMTLIGNSSWLDERSLLNQVNVTRDMLIISPLLPFADRQTELYVALDGVEDFDLTPWQLLGLDAADFVAAAMSAQVNNGADFVDAARDVGHFSGSAVEVEISAAGENRLARIIRFDGEELKVVK